MLLDFYKVKDIMKLCYVKSKSTIMNKIHCLVDDGILKSHCLENPSIMLNRQEVGVFLDRFYPSVYDVVKDELCTASYTERGSITMTSCSNGKVYQPTGKDYWYIRGFVLARTIDGKDILYKNKTKFKTKEDVQKYRQRLIKQREKGEFLKLATEEARNVQNSNTKKPKTFIKYAEEYIDSLKLAERTRKDYHSILKIHLEPFFNKVRIEEISGQIIRNFAKSREGKGQITKTRTLLNKILDALKAEELITYNGYKEISYPKDEGKDTQLKESLNKEELRLLLEGCRDHRIEHAIVLLFNTGLRIGELQALTWDDIEYYPNNSIRVIVNKAWGDIGVGKGNKEAKNKYSNRIVFVSPNSYLVNLLKKAKGKAQGCKYVLYNSKHTGPIETNNFNTRYLKVIAKKVGIKKNVTAHVARHTYISMCLDSGIKPVDIARQVGHKDTTMIVKRYGHVVLEAEEAFKDFSVSIDTLKPTVNTGFIAS